MMTELMLVEGVSDVQLISYYLQNIYGWKYEKQNRLGINPLDEHEHIECLSKGDDHLVLCGVGGNGKFAYFVERHRVNTMIIEQDISSLMVVTDRDEGSDAKVRRKINSSLENILIKNCQWTSNNIIDSFGQSKRLDTFLLIIPEKDKGALEKVIINALAEIPDEKDLIHEVVEFIESLSDELVPELKKTNKANKASVGTFFSIRCPQNAMRAFGTFLFKVDWSKSKSLRELFLPFMYLGEEKPT